MSWCFLPERQFSSNLLSAHPPSVHAFQGNCVQCVQCVSRQVPNCQHFCVCWTSSPNHLWTNGLAIEHLPQPEAQVGETPCLIFSVVVLFGAVDAFGRPVLSQTPSASQTEHLNHGTRMRLLERSCQERTTDSSSCGRHVQHPTSSRYHQRCTEQLQGTVCIFGCTSTFFFHGRSCMRPSPLVLGHLGSGCFPCRGAGHARGRLFSCRW